MVRLWYNIGVLTDALFPARPPMFPRRRAFCVQMKRACMVAGLIYVIPWGVFPNLQANAFLPDEHDAPAS